MIRRLFYHGFWNFYDYLGTLTLFGAVHGIIAFGILVLMTYASPGVDSPAGLVSVFALELIVAVLFLAALMPYCAKAARGEAARWNMFWPGFKSQWLNVSKILFATALLITVLVVNLIFYTKIQQQTTGAVQMFILGISSIIGWAVILLLVFLGPWLAASTAASERLSVKISLRKGIMVFALVPLMWFLIFVILAAIMLSGFSIRITFIFVLPSFAILSQTAYYLSEQYVRFIVDAQTELGAGQSLRSYKKRAMELAWNWEMLQPRRTLKELIRPWEY